MQPSGAFKVEWAEDTVFINFALAAYYSRHITGPGEVARVRVDVLFF